MIVVNDESTAAELAAAIGQVNDLTKDSPHVFGTLEDPSLWDRRHGLLDAMLTDWQARAAAELTPS
jgi:hypothetical protein